MKAVLIVDPLNDFLNHKGVAWSAVEKSVKKNNTIQNLKNIIEYSNKNNIKIFVSPHCYTNNEDVNWKFGGFIEKFMLKNKMFFTKFGCEIIEELRDGLKDAVVCSAHKIYGPQTTDLNLQLRKNGIDEVFVAGMSANLCVESHIRHLLECGFKVNAIKDATAGASLPIGDGYESALVNFHYICSSVLTTKEFCKQPTKKSSKKKPRKAIQ
jgi:biuret amidohydrolase